MPGVHFVYDRNSEDRRQPSEDALRPLLHFDDYRSEVLHRDSRSWLAVTRYPEYPIATFALDDCFVLLEGRIYGLDEDQVRRHVSDLASLLFQDTSESRAGIRDWLMTHDGDYIIVAQHRATGSWAIINDPLARLPLYASSADGRLVVSRDITFVAGRLQRVGMDRMALAQQVLFDAPLGRRTMLHDIDRLPPATLIQVDGKQGTVRQTIVSTLSLDAAECGDSLELMADSLVATFVDACRRMQVGGKSVVSLSGGLDSRSVAAGLALSGGRPRTVTFIDAECRARVDAELASEIAYALGLPWELVTLPFPTGADADLLLRLKGGMNYTAMAMSMPYFSYIRERHGAGIAYFTGDGGDRLLPDVSGPGGIDTVDQLARHAIRRHQLLPLPIAARLFGLDPGDITAEVAAIMDSYPESTTAAKYRGFHVRDRAMKWLVEGEDRNRAFFWSCSPFYTLSFFKAAMAVPAEVKKYNRLYLAFLMRLSPAAAQIPDAKRGFSITDPRYGRELRLIALANRYPRALRRLKSFLKPPATYRPDANVLRILTRQLESSETVREYLDPSELEKLIASRASWPRELFDNLLTITTMIERLHTGTDCLQEFLEEELS